MKKFTLAAVLLGGITIISKTSYAQSTSNDRLTDSIQTVERGKSQQQVDEERMGQAKAAKAESKARSKEAGRVQNEAEDAEKQSNLSLKREKQAQKARKNADKQAQKAQNAKNKSDKN